MKLGFYSASAALMQNRMFTDANVSSGAGDDLLLPFVRLAQQAEQQGIECITVDMANMDTFDAFVFCEMPAKSNEFLQHAVCQQLPRFLIIAENHFICKGNEAYERYAEFSRVFTYNDAALDLENVVKLNYAFDLPRQIPKNFESKDRFSVMICSNHKRDLKDLVYAKRRETIEWFEANQPEAFDLYGLGWERGTLAFQTRPRLQRTIRKFGLLRFFPTRKYISWKGRVDRKRDVLGKYRFGFCYENTDQIPGYITEKIFDVMLAGTVPVYLGAENTPSHVPSACYVNRADFSDDGALYDYLSQMPDVEYRAYLDRIDSFLSSEESSGFAITSFVRILMDEFQSYVKKGAASAHC